MDVQRAIFYLVENEGLILPHGITPGSYPGGQNTEFDQTRWVRYMWNPVPRFLGLGKHIGASPKPTWARLAEVDSNMRREELRAAAYATLDSECHRRITADAYNARDFQHETEIRLRDAHTPAQDTERDRLRAVRREHKELIGWMSLKTLEKYDPAADSVWAKPPPVPAIPDLKE